METQIKNKQKSNRKIDNGKQTQGPQILILLGSYF